MRLTKKTSGRQVREQKILEKLISLLTRRGAGRMRKKFWSTTLCLKEERLNAVIRKRVHYSKPEKKSY